MYYFKQDNKSHTIDKYDVEYEEGVIRTIRRDVIDNCSEVVHKKKRSRKGKIVEDGEMIRDVHEKFALNKTSGYEDVDLYDVTYIEYKPPKLVSWIDKFLKGDTSSISHLIGSDVEVEDRPVSYDEEIRIANAKIDNIDNSNYEAKVAALNELKLLLESPKDRSTRPYLDQLKNAITLTKCATLPLDSLDRVLTFFGKGLDDLGLDKIINEDTKKDEKKFQMQGGSN